MKLMFIFAHPDDESFSAGGTIAKYVSQSHNVYTVCLTSTPERKKEYITATKVLKVTRSFIFDYEHLQPHQEEVIDDLTNLLIDIGPNIVITHLDYDYHHEHRLTYKLVREAIEWSAHVTQHPNAHMVSKLYSTETTILIPRPHVLVDISQHYTLKEKAMRSYKSQLSKGGEEFYIKFHRYRTLMRGVQAGCQHAEAFIQHPLIRSGPFYPKRHDEL